MAEYINRDEFIISQCHSCDGACEDLNCDCLNCKSIYRCAMIQDLMEFPAEEVEPVVRCRDCIYGEFDNLDFPLQYFCRYYRDLWENESHYCSHGKRRDEA